MRTRGLKFISMLAWGFAPEAVYAQSYVVRAGDCLTKIIQDSLPGFIHGKHGNLKKTLALNPGLAANPHHLMPGQKIILPGVRKISSADGAPLPEPTPHMDKTVNSEGPLMHMGIGYGGKYLAYNQSGSLGGLNGAVMAANSFHIGAAILGESWNLRAEMEQFSAEFPADTTNPASRTSKKFQTISLRPGYGALSVGMRAKKSPMVVASGTVLNWGDVTSLWGLASFRIESDRSLNRSSSPFIIGAELQGAYPLRASGDGGNEVSTPTGFSVSISGFGEKALYSSQHYRLSLGLEGSASHEVLKVRTKWGGNSGNAKREIQEIGSRVYLGLVF